MPKVNFITFSGVAITDEEESYDEDIESSMVMGVERTVPQTRAARKQAYDNVKTPVLDKGKQCDLPLHLARKKDQTVENQSAPE